MSRISRQLGQLLVDNRLITKDDLEHELQRAETMGVPLATLLVSDSAVRESDILRVVAERLGIEFVALEPSRDEVQVDVDVLRLVDVGVARQLQALPLRREDDGTLIIAVPDPFSQDKLGKLRRAAQGEVRLALAPRQALKRMIDEQYEILAKSPPSTQAGGGKPHMHAAAVLRDEDERDHPHINELLEVLLDKGGSDLHLTAGSPPQVRVNGSLVALEGFGKMKPAGLRSMIYEILTSRQREEFEERRELDCSHPLPGRGRFRVNVFFQRDSVGSVMRAIPNNILGLDQLGMPAVVQEFAKLGRGLVLVTGPTGSGKSTTLASLIDVVNSTRSCHVMTVEDPIEFMHKHKASIVNQREVGADTLSFAAALKHALRQDPDVILVGEMRDLETISTAITASETGHLVFATLHTQDAPQSIERMIDVFPSHQQQQVRVQLASSIQAVVSQQLLPTKDGGGRISAVEVMVATPAIRNLIREGKVHQITSVMQSGAKYGMQTMDQCLANLVKAGRVAHKVAVERSQHPEDFEALVGGAR